MRGIAEWSELFAERLDRSESVNDLLETGLLVLDDLLGFRHATILLADERNGKLFTIASRGYVENGVRSKSDTARARLNPDVGRLSPRWSYERETYAIYPIF